MNSYILPESFFQLTTIHRTQFFVQKHGRIHFSNKCISGLTVTKFALVFRTNEFLQSMIHGIFPCISKKQIISVTVTEFDFVFYTKNMKIQLKNVFALFPLCIATIS